MAKRDRPTPPLSQPGASPQESEGLLPKRQSRLPAREAEELAPREGLDVFRDRMKVRSGGRQNKRAGGWIEDAMGEFLLQSGLRRALRSRHEQAPRSEDEEE